MLDQSLVLWLQDTVTTAVPDTYMYDSEELEAYLDGREENLPLMPETWFNLDGEVGIALYADRGPSMTKR